jgi:hypothetical protein
MFYVTAILVWLGTVALGGGILLVVSPASFLRWRDILSLSSRLTLHSRRTRAPAPWRQAVLDGEYRGFAVVLIGIGVFLWWVLVRLLWAVLVLGRPVPIVF